MAEERILEEQLKGRSSKKSKKKKKGAFVINIWTSTCFEITQSGSESLIYVFGLQADTDSVCGYFSVRPLNKEITMSQAYQNMCAGMYKVGKPYYYQPFLVHWHNLSPPDRRPW